MNRLELKNELEFILSNNSNQDDPDFTSARLLKALDSSYRQIWNYVRQHVSKAHLLESYDFTWESGEDTMELPDPLKDKALYAFYDVTSDQADYALRLTFETRNVLRWYSDGPTGDTDIRAYFVSAAEKLETDESVPRLIPTEHHDLIALQAAIILKEIADQEVPPSWERRRERLEMDLIKDLSVRPIADRARIMSQDMDTAWLIGFV